MSEIFDEDLLKNSISQAMLWLGYRDVKFGKKFSTKKFTEGLTGEDVLDYEIIYENNTGIIPKSIEKKLAKLLENVVNYHLKTNIKTKEQDELESENI